MARDLLLELAPDGVDHYEILHIVQGHYRTARSEPDGDTVYPGQDEYSLKLRARKGEIACVEPGPSFSNEDFDQLKAKVRDALDGDQSTRIERCVLFSSNPITGFFRSRGEELQILPPPASAPIPPQLIADHPFVIEFSIRVSPDGLITNIRRMRGMLEWTWFLHAVLCGSIRCIGPSSRFMWALSPPADGSPTTQEHIRWSQEMYFIDGFVSQQDAFSEPDGLPVELVSNQQYFGEPRGIGTPFVLPEVFPELIRSFMNLSHEDRRTFMRAIQWVYVAGAEWIISKSSYYLGNVFAIESLMPDQVAIPCPTCGRDRSPGPTQRFREFINQYAPDGHAQPLRARRRLYSVRSRLAHGGDHLWIDAAPWDWSLSATSADEWEMFTAINATVRTVLFNWLGQRR